jgi:hypothetical protein
MDARSIGDVPEQELVESLVADRILRSAILSAAGATNASRFLLRVPIADIAAESGEKGDVDLVAYPGSDTHLAAAYEFKRVKISSHTFHTGKPNKLAELSKAIQQANALARLGFNRVVLAVLLVTDGRERTEFNFAFRGATNDLLRTVESAIHMSDLHKDVGVCRFEVVQPIDREFTLSGGIGIRALRIPKVRRQPDELTSQIEHYASRTAHA